MNGLASALLRGTPLMMFGTTALFMLGGALALAAVIWFVRPFFIWWRFERGRKRLEARHAKLLERRRRT